MPPWVGCAGAAEACGVPNGRLAKCIHPQPRATNTRHAASAVAHAVRKVADLPAWPGLLMPG
ncbi:hypothetical protein A5658_25960 [Mycobacterium sp. 1245111.1]|nr:hypothetical protein A5658_25960 [Mycobacterium sp. 1245111.1]